MFELNQIFDGDYPEDAATWCNKNGAYIKEIDSQNGVRRFEIVAVPEPTAEELADLALAQAKAERAAAVAALTVEVDGMIFDGNEKAQERMARAVSMADSLEEETEWVLHDNTVAIVTAAQLRQACRKAGKAQTALWTVPYQAKNEQTEAETEEAEA